MPHFKKVLLISALTVSLAACSTNSDTQSSSTSPTASPETSSITPSPQNTESTPSAGNKRFAQEIKLTETLKSGKAGEKIKIPVTVTNTSNFVWKHDGANLVNFSYNWFDASGKRVVFDAERTPLTKSLPPQESENLNAVIKLPDKPGQYTLIPSMVQEGVAWFYDAGAQAPRIAVTITK